MFRKFFHLLTPLMILIFVGMTWAQSPQDGDTDGDNDYYYLAEDFKIQIQDSEGRAVATPHHTNVYMTFPKEGIKSTDADILKVENKIYGIKDYKFTFELDNECKGNLKGVVVVPKDKKYKFKYIMDLQPLGGSQKEVWATDTSDYHVIRLNKVVRHWWEYVIVAACGLTMLILSVIATQLIIGKLPEDMRDKSKPFCLLSLLFLSLLMTLLAFFYPGVQSNYLSMGLYLGIPTLLMLSIIVILSNMSSDV